MSQIIQLQVSDKENAKPDLIELLIDAVHSGVSVGFLPPLELETAAEYWDGVFDGLHSADNYLLAIRDAESKIIASIQLACSTKKTATHRAEGRRLLVHTKHRRQGLGFRLMKELDVIAQSRGRSLLVINTRKGDPSEQLHYKVGYQKAGEIPHWARSANGNLHTTVILYKHL